jgi:hypothetical protein
MLRRAKRLKSALNLFCSEYGRNDLSLDGDEWRQIEYLLWITQPFFTFTTALSRTKDVTVHLIFEIYNKLFDHLEISIRQLKRKRVPWKRLMLSAIEAAKAKLSFYYQKTDELHNDIFAVSTILAPENKLQFFTGRDWDETWRKRYHQSFENYVTPYKQRLQDMPSSPSTLSSKSARSKLNLLLKGSKPHRFIQRDELTQYLDSGKSTKWP